MGTVDKGVLFHEGCWAVEGYGVSSWQRFLGW